MSNSRRLRRSILGANGHAVLSQDDRPGADQVISSSVPQAGAINGYNCTTCQKLTMVQHLDAGVTPAFMACLATPGCDGTGESIRYPNQDNIPDRVRAAVRFEWYRPTKRQFNKLDDETKTHVARGGLLLRSRI